MAAGTGFFGATGFFGGAAASTAYVPALPGGCARSGPYYACGGAYYQPVYDGPKHATDLLRWWLAHPDERAETALKARAAIDDRVFGNAAAAVLRLLEKE